MQLFRRALLALATVFVLAAPASAAEFLDYTPQALASAQREGAPVLVVVAADWCPTCRAQEARIRDIATDHAFDQMVVIRIDYDQQRDAWRALGVRERSTLIAYHGVRETARLIGETDGRQIDALMRTALR